MTKSSNDNHFTFCAYVYRSCVLAEFRCKATFWSRGVKTILHRTGPFVSVLAHSGTKTGPVCFLAKCELISRGIDRL